MHSALADWLNSHSEDIKFFVSSIFQAIYITIGLSLWDKDKLPFTWRRVWSLFFLILGLGTFLANLLSKLGK